MESMWHGWSKLYSFFFRITISQFMNFSKAQSRCNMVEDIESMPWYIRHNHAERKKNEKKLWFSCKVSWCAVIRCYVEYRWSFFAYNTYCAKPWRKRNAMWLAITRSVFICGIYHKGKKWPTLSLLHFLRYFSATIFLPLTLCLAMLYLFKALSHLPIISICLIARHRSRTNIIKEMHQPVVWYSLPSCHFSIASMVKATDLNLVCMSVVCGMLHTLLFSGSYAIIIKTHRKKQIAIENQRQWRIVRGLGTISMRILFAIKKV